MAACRPTKPNSTCATSPIGCSLSCSVTPPSPARTSRPSERTGAATTSSLRPDTGAVDRCRMTTTPAARAGAAASEPNTAALTTTETMLQPPGIAVRDICIRAADNYPLAATLFQPKEANASLTIIAPAVGVSSRYYRNFASYLAERGRPSLIFDYRGMGASRRGSLEKFPARMRDWCILDVPTVLEWAAQIHARPLAWVGHSMGGFATGLAQNNHLIDRQLNIATLSGYWGHMARP